MFRIIALLTFLLMLAAAAGCGDDDDDTTGGGGSGGSGVTPGHGVSGDKTLSSLSQDEIDKICSDLEKSVQPLVSEFEGFDEYICIASGMAYAVQTGGDEATCEEAKKSCLDMLAQPGADAGTEETPGDISCPTKEEFAECEATVREMDACFSAAMKLARELADTMKTYSCDDVGEIEDAGSLMDPVADIAEPPECERLQAKCPSMSD